MPHDSDHLLTIGAVSRASGLSVSALRFYDREGVLAPASVDAWSGYRRYSPGQVREARLLAGMRRVQMPVAEMTSLLEAVRAGDEESAQELLHGHLRRLEQGVAQARREIERLAGLLSDPARGSADIGAERVADRGVTLPASALGGLLRAVRPAVGTDPELPALHGVLLELIGSALTLVATDRYRMVVARHGDPAEADDIPQAVVLPTHEVDRLLARLAGDGEVTLAVADERVEMTDDAGTLVLTPADVDFPDYRRVVEAGTATEPVGAAEVERALASEERMTRLGDLRVDREFLWDAVRAVPGGQVLLPADGVITPLMVRSPDERTLALVMPIAPEGR